MQAQNITFIGLTRASLSVALALKKGLPDLNRIGHDPDEKLTKQAVEHGVFNSGEQHVDKALAKADILIIDMNAAATEKLLPLMSQMLQEHVVITHLSPQAVALQKSFDKQLPEHFFVNAAPVQSMATFGPASADPIESADADLFRDSLYCLMPSSMVDEAAVDTVRAIGKVIGGSPFFIDPSEYDVYINALELLPRLSQVALFESLHSQTAWSDMRRLAGNRFASGTANFADQGEEIASAVFANKDSTLHWINQHINALMEIKGWIEKTDERTVADLINTRSFERDIWLQTRKDNHWNETAAPEIGKEGVKDLFMGSLLGRRGRG